MKNTSQLLNILLALALVFVSAKLALNGNTRHDKSDDKNNNQSSKVSVVAELGKEEKVGAYTRSEIDPFANSGIILNALKKGILLTTKVGDKTNMMTIGWGTIGIDWSKQVFVGYVRQSRYTHEMLSKNGEFTINIDPTGGSNKIIEFAGTKSGRDTDKAKELNLTLVDGAKVGVPAILEMPLTLECKVLYVQDQKRELLPKDIQDKMYPIDEKNPGGNMHTMFYAEIVDAYILKK